MTSTSRLTERAWRLTEFTARRCASELRKADVFIRPIPKKIKPIKCPNCNSTRIVRRISLFEARTSKKLKHETSPIEWSTLSVTNSAIAARVHTVFIGRRVYRHKDPFHILVQNETVSRACISLMSVTLRAASVIAVIIQLVNCGYGPLSRSILCCHWHPSLLPLTQRGPCPDFFGGSRLIMNFFVSFCLSCRTFLSIVAKCATLPRRSSNEEGEHIS